MKRIRSIRTRIANGLGWLRVGLCRLMSPPVTIHTSKMDQWQKLSLSLSLWPVGNPIIRDNQQ